MTWAREGDRNTSFFHRVATDGKAINTIEGLFNKDGVWCDRDRDIEAVITDYFGEFSRQLTRGRQ